MSSMASISFKNKNLKGQKKKTKQKTQINKTKRNWRKTKKEKIADIATNH